MTDVKFYTNPQHLEEIKKGVVSWNQFVARCAAENEGWVAWLEGADLTGCSLIGADL